MSARIPPAQLPHWGSVADAAERLGVNPRTIRRMIARGDVEARRFGPRLVRVDLSALDAAGTPLRYRGDDR